MVLRRNADVRIVSFLLAVALMATMLCGVISPLTAYAMDSIEADNGDGTTTRYEITEELPSDNVIVDGGVYGVSGDYADNIVVNTTEAVVLVLDGVTYASASATSPLQLRANADVTLILVDDSTNSFICNGTSTTVGAIQAGIHVPPGASLTIMGQSENTGELLATGGDYSAGIGGGPNQGSGNITIKGGIITSTSGGPGSGKGNAAGIGGGGGNTSLGGDAGSIVICGNANVIAASTENAAGIGGGGSRNLKGGSATQISIYGNAIVSATSGGHGAGIGGGATGTAGTHNNPAGSGGTIEIYENAKVDARSSGNGAGIGGGGTTVTSTAGSGGTMEISGNAIVTAASDGNGAGIGGGGSTTGVAGAGGEITISGNPIVTATTASAQSKAVDIGPGINSSGAHTIVSSDFITITSGNVFALKTDEAHMTLDVTNGYGQKLRMVELTDTAGAVITVDVTAESSPLGKYTYSATANEYGQAYMWLPILPGHQFIRYWDDSSDTEIYHETIILTTTDTYTFEPPIIPNYTATPGQTVTYHWNVATSEVPTPIVFHYTRNTSALKLVAYDFVTKQEITASNVAITKSVTKPTNTNYSYDAEIADLTDMVEDAHPGQYEPVYHDPGKHFIEEDAANNIIKVFYVPHSTTFVTVQCMDAASPTDIIFEYTVPAAPGETITLNDDSAKGKVDYPDLSDRGFTYDAGDSRKKLSATGDDSADDTILFYYTREVKDLVLEAYTYTLGSSGGVTIRPIKDSSGDIISVRVKDQPIRENYDYYSSGHVASLTDMVDYEYSGEYIEVPQGSHIYNIVDSVDPDANKVKVFYASRPTDAIPVEARIGSRAGQLIVMYAVPVKPGEQLTLSSLNVPDLTVFGFKLDEAASVLTAREGDPDSKLIAIYTDNRFTVTIRNSVDTSVVSDKVTFGNTRLIYPPQKDGYNVTAYSVNGGSKVSITSSYAGYSASSATDITFHYTRQPTGGGTSTPTPTPTAKLTILCVAKSGQELFSQSLTSVVGNTETIKAFPLQGYTLAAGESAARIIEIQRGENVVRFVYDELAKPAESQGSTGSTEGTTPTTTTVSQMTTSSSGGTVSSEVDADRSEGDASSSSRDTMAIDDDLLPLGSRTSEDEEGEHLQAVIASGTDEAIMCDDCEASGIICIHLMTEAESCCRWCWIWLLTAFICGYIVGRLVRRRRKRRGEEEHKADEGSIVLETYQ